MNRFKTTESGYRFDRIIFTGVFLIIVGLVLFIMFSNSFNFTPQPYFKCYDITCENPFYIMTDCTQTLKILWLIPLYTTPDCRSNCDWCYEPMLPMGEYGSRPKNEWLIDNIAFISFMLLIGSLFLNHFLHNKNKPFDLEIRITKKLIINRKKLEEWASENDKDNKQN